MFPGKAGRVLGWDLELGLFESFAGLGTGFLSYSRGVLLLDVQVCDICCVVVYT